MNEKKTNFEQVPVINNFFDSEFESKSKKLSELDGQETDLSSDDWNDIPQFSKMDLEKSLAFKNDTAKKLLEWDGVIDPKEEKIFENSEGDEVIDLKEGKDYKVITEDDVKQIEYNSVGDSNEAEDDKNYEPSEESFIDNEEIDELEKLNKKIALLEKFSEEQRRASELEDYEVEGLEKLKEKRDRLKNKINGAKSDDSLDIEGVDFQKNNETKEKAAKIGFFDRIKLYMREKDLELNERDKMYVEEDLKYVNKEIKKVGEVIKSTDDLIKVAKDKIQNLESKNQDLSSRVEEVQGKLDLSNANYQEMQVKKDIEFNNGEIKKLKKVLEKAENKKKEVILDEKYLIKDKQDLEFRIEIKNIIIKKYKEKRGEIADKFVKAYSEKIEPIKEEVSNLESNRKELKSLADKMQKNHEEETQNLGALEDELQNLEGVLRENGREKEFRVNFKNMRDHIDRVKNKIKKDEQDLNKKTEIVSNKIDSTSNLTFSYGEKIWELENRKFLGAYLTEWNSFFENEDKLKIDLPEFFRLTRLKFDLSEKTETTLTRFIKAIQFYCKKKKINLKEKYLIKFKKELIKK